MKSIDVFLYTMYGVAIGYVIYFLSYIYNKSTTTVVYNQLTPVYPETVIYPWSRGGYNWYPYWNGWWSGGRDGGYNGNANYKNTGHIGNYTRGRYHSGNRPWGSNSGRGANGVIGGGHSVCVHSSSGSGGVHSSSCSGGVHSGSSGSQ